MISDNHKSQEIKNLVNMQQSDVVKSRWQNDRVKFTENKLRRFFGEPIVDVCECCRRKRPIVNQTRKLCKYCVAWCCAWLKKKYGFVKYQQINEAYEEFQKPIKCRFFEQCGNYIPRVMENGRITNKRTDICKKCFLIYNSGRTQGRLQRIKSQIGFTQGVINGLSGHRH